MERIIEKQTAIMAKKAGFGCDCVYYYFGDNPISYYHPSVNNSELGKIEYAAPTQSELSKWLREYKNIHVYSSCTSCGWYWSINKTNGDNISDSGLLGDSWDSYEEALEAGLLKALEILKEMK